MTEKIECFKLNDKIELTSKDENKTFGFVYDIKDGKIYISISADDENFKLINTGEKIRAAIPSKNQIISFDGIITDRLFEKASIYELSDLKNFRRIQRRENIRVSFTKELLYTDDEKIINSKILDKDIEEALESIEDSFKEGLMLDLSAGGLKLSIRKNYEVGQKLLFLMEFKGEKMLLKGRIVHKELNLVPKNTVYLYGIKFIGIRENQKEKIIKHLFVIMRKNMIK